MATIAQILMEQGRHAAESRRSRSSAWQPFIQQLANLPGQIMQDRQAERAGQEAGYDRQQQRDMREQQLAKGQQEISAGEMAASDEAAMAEIFSSPGILGEDGSIDLRKATQLAQQQAPRLVPRLTKAAQEFDEAVQQAALRAAQTASANRANQPTPPAPYTLSPGQQRRGADNAIVAEVPAEVKPDTRALNQQLKDAIQRGDRPEMNAIRQAIRQAAEAGREPQGAGNGDPGPLETIIGLDGKAIRVARRDAIGKPPAAGTEKASSGVQKRVLNFFNRADQADKDLEALEPEIEKLGFGGQLRQALAPNFAQTQLGQSYTAAQRAFTEARLRKDSGAAIPPHEFESDRKTYFVQPGDSKKTIQDKNRARATMLASLAFESGQALGEFIGDADEARGIVEGYKARAAGKPTPARGGATDQTDTLLDELLRGGR